MATKTTTKKTTKTITTKKTGTTTTKKPVKKTTTKTTTTKTSASTKIPAWEVVLNVMSPTIKRPRRTSLHTLATVLGHKDPLKLAKEMKASGKVLGYNCPDVRTPIFYLKALRHHPGMIDTPSSRIWETLPNFFKKHPYPEVKGFKRFAGYKWTGGSYGKGKYIAESSAMNVPYEKGDYAYANAIITALKKAGYTPGITAYKI